MFIQQLEIELLVGLILKSESVCFCIKTGVINNSQDSSLSVSTEV